MLPFMHETRTPPHARAAHLVVLTLMPQGLLNSSPSLADDLDEMKVAVLAEMLGAEFIELIVSLRTVDAD